MKKVYLSILACALISLSHAQQIGKTFKSTKYNSTIEKAPTKPVINTEKAFVIWEDDCSVAGNWTLTNSSAPALNWSWTTDVTATPAFGDANMTTASNGYFLINSDAAGNAASQDASVTYNLTDIDLGAYSDVILEFEHHYRTFEDARTVSVSADGGMSWTDYVITTNDNAEANVNFAGTTQINISAVAGNIDNVLIKFNYIGNWGWHWAIDDIRIIEQPINDIHLLTSWYVGENNEGIEYGRTPLDQLDANYIVGSRVSNFGTTDQTMLDVDADFVSFSTNLLEPLLASGDTVDIEMSIAAVTATGVYDGTYTAVSAEETMGPEFFNNSYLRSFAVTDNIYSIDGAGVYPAAVSELASYGTTSSSSAGSADGIMLANYYAIKQQSQLSGFELILGSNTVAGGEVYISIIDTANFFNDDISPLYLRNAYEITAADVTAGKATIFFDNVITLDANAYFFAAELYSNDNSNTISLIDDITVDQPTYASMIYVPADLTVYTNGNAFALRLLMGDTWGVGLNENNLSGVSIYPNPSEGIVNITNDKNTQNSIEVYDLLGNSILTTSANTATTVDLSSNASGIYMIVVSNENGSIVERVSIK
ncbi:MAG: T9SS type A sorting domain-containing protein [Crocinitomicaceae bacterium]